MAKTNQETIEVLIIAAEVTKGMKSIGSKSLLKIKNSLMVIEYQIEELRKAYKNINITVAVGFEADRMIKVLEKESVSFLYNSEYETTNQAKSVIDFLNKKIPNNLLLISSGILFKNFPLMQKSNSGFSEIFVLDKPKADFTIGCHHDTSLSYLFYDLPQKWCECVMLNNKDTVLLKKITENTNIDQLYLFEIINLLSDNGCKFQKTSILKNNIMKISNSKDLARARSFI